MLERTLPGLRLVSAAGLGRDGRLNARGRGGGGASQYSRHSTGRPPTGSPLPLKADLPRRRGIEGRRGAEGEEEEARRSTLA